MNKRTSLGGCDLRVSFCKVVGKIICNDVSIFSKYIYSSELTGGNLSAVSNKDIFCSCDMFWRERCLTIDSRLRFNGQYQENGKR